ncbi:MAG: hypothetical protein NTU66_06595 [Elusimicrobia bacterium]|nr:hypothetical protein [Elusimicrobiota bacterium]
MNLMKISYSRVTSVILAVLAPILLVGLTACNRPSYPADRVAASVQELIKKEYGMEGTAKVVGDTLYLDIRLSELTTTDAKKLTKVMEEIQGAVLTITRVALSTDASLKFLVLTGNDPAWQIGLRIIEYLQDVKDYFYQRISRGDYEERLIFELEYGGDAQLLFAEQSRVFPGNNGSVESYVVPNADRGMSMNEFAGRLIVSQFNTMNRSNPFLSVVLNNTKLRYVAFQDQELIIKAANQMSASLKPLTQKLLIEQTNKIAKKYSAFQIKQIRIVGEGTQSMIIPVPPVIHTR